jgi:hypothetical protein
MSGIPASPSAPPDHHNQTAAKGTRETGEAARDEAFDDFASPPDIRRVYIGGAVHTLERRRLIRKTGELRFTMQAGRHGSYYPVWTLAVNSTAVTEWRSSNPFRPNPRHRIETHGAGRIALIRPAPYLASCHINNDREAQHARTIR